MSKYQYRPIKSPDYLRVLYLLPGEPSDPIHIKLCHHSLSVLPSCEALSYEWGSPTRDVDILCEGKILKVTPNLLVALKRLRGGISDSSHPRLLWIDATCINQDDVAERSEQVKLMTDIYRNARRVVIWVGEEVPTTAHAMETIEELAEIFESLNLDEHDFTKTTLSNDFKAVLKAKILPGGLRLEALPESPRWPALLELLASRTVFLRLWTVQEVALASVETTVVLCGNHLQGWLEFCRATALILGLGFHKRSVLLTRGKLVILHAVYDRWQTSKNVSTASLYVLMARYRDQSISDPRDRVFALLGLLDDATRSALAQVNYSSSVGEVFQAAFKFIALDVNTVDHLSWRESLCDRNKEARLPSWASFISSGVDEMAATLELDQYFNSSPVRFEGNVLYTQGFVFDIISHAYDNFSPHNIRHIIMDSCIRCHMLTRASYTSDFAVDALFQALLLHEGRKDTFADLRQLIFGGFSRWSLEYISKTRDAMEKSARLRDIAQNNPEMRLEYPEAVAADLDIKTLRSRHKLLDSLIQKLLAGHLLQPWERDWDRLIRRVMLHYDYTDGLKYHQGRNLFVSYKSYQGVGPYEHQAEAPAVQVGDHIVLIPTVAIPLILRPCEDGLYTLIGPAHIPFITDAPCFQTSEFLPLEEIRIR